MLFEKTFTFLSKKFFLLNSSLTFTSTSKHKMKNLIEKLTKETQVLKVEYLEKVKQWAVGQVQRNIERRKAYYYSKKSDYSFQNDYYREQKWVHSTPSWMFNEQEFVLRTEKSAVEHYENSIVKLADRIIKKDLNQDNIKIKTARVGVNIETVITDGTKTVYARTIIASGEIQRPHYRYIIS